MKNLTQQITEEFAREQRTAGKAITPDDIPLSYEAITPEWLTHILCKGHTDARVTDYHLDASDEGSTNRRRIFIRYNAEGDAAQLPTSVFCKATQQLANRLALANCGQIDGEVNFYNHYRPLLDIETPHCLLATYDSRSYNSIIVLDDLARLGAKFCNYDTDITRQQAEKQMTLLARLHGRFHQSREYRESGLGTFTDFFNKIDTWYDITKCCNAGFLAAEAVIPPRLFRRYDEVWPATQKAAVANGALAHTFTHCDLHSRNWYVTADGQMGLTDWQSLVAGHWARDVAYCISADLLPENRRAWEKDLLQLYLQQLHAAGGPAVPFDEAWKQYRQQLFTALAWWTLTLTPSGGDSGEAPPDFQPQAASLTFIGRMATAIDDLDAFDSFD